MVTDGSALPGVQFCALEFPATRQAKKIESNTRRGICIEAPQRSTALIRNIDAAIAVQVCSGGWLLRVAQYLWKFFIPLGAPVFIGLIKDESNFSAREDLKAKHQKLHKTAYHATARSPSYSRGASLSFR